MSARRPFCLWVRSPHGMSSYALRDRYSSPENADKALRRDFPTGRTALGQKVEVGHEHGSDAFAKSREEQ